MNFTQGSKANKKVSIKYNVTVDEIISGAEENAAFNDDFPVHIRFNDGTVEGFDTGFSIINARLSV